MAYYTESDPRFAPKTVVVGDAEQVVAQQAPHERVWQELARQQGISPVVIAGTGDMQEYVPNPQYEAWKASQKAQGIEVGMQDIPGTNYSKEAVILQNGVPITQPTVVKTGSTFGEGLMEIAPIALAALGGQFLGAGGTLSAAEQAAALTAGNIGAATTATLPAVAGAGAAGGIGAIPPGIAEGMAPGVLAPATAAEMAGVNAVLAGGAGAAGAGAAGAGAAGTAGAAGAGAAGAAGQAAAGAAGSALGNLGTAALVGAAGDILGGIVQSKAAETAADAQERAALAGIEEMRRQFNVSKEILQPYVSAGTQAIGGLQPYMQGGQQAYQQQLALAGVLGPEAQKAAISQIESSPFFQSQVEQGERALLQRASATGGLRGGNLQAGLAQFRPQMLQQAIEQQYGRLGGLSAAGLETGGLVSRLGQASAAGQASQAGALGQGVAGLMQQQGAAQAGAALAGAAPWQALANIPGQLAGLSLATGRPITSLFG